MPQLSTYKIFVVKKDNERNFKNLCIRIRLSIAHQQSKDNCSKQFKGQNS